MQQYQLENSGNTRPNKVLLLDAYSTRTLACVRSWGRRGIPFALGGQSRLDMGLYSRYCKERFTYTGPKVDIAAFLRDVNRASVQFGADCVLPTSEAAILACSRYRQELLRPPLVPTDEQIETMFSKTNTLRLAESLGLHIPRTLRVSERDLSALETSDLAYPAVIKSESSEILGDSRAVTGAKTTYAYDKRTAMGECRTRIANGHVVLVQEFIDGYGLGVSGLFCSGKPVALLAHRRIRESTPTGGPSALAETVPIEPALLDATKAMMGKIGLTGPAMVEFRIERASGRPFLMEINGRFWGMVLLAPLAGLDLPYLFWKVLNGEEIAPEETTYQIGIRGRYLIGDTKCLALCLRGRPRHWPGAFPKRWPALLSYSGSFFDGRTTELILTRDDCRPFFARLLQLAT